jgi:hypothetical protein
MAPKTKPSAGDRNFPGSHSCQYCGDRHLGTCPSEEKVRALEPPMEKMLADLQANGGYGDLAQYPTEVVALALKYRRIAVVAGGEGRNIRLWTNHPLESELQRFLSEAKPLRPSVSWIKCREMQAYIRSGGRMLGEELVPSFELGNIEVKGRYRRHGLFAGLLARMEELGRAKGYRVLYIENAMNPIIQEWAARHRWIIVDSTELSASYMKVL